MITIAANLEQIVDEKLPLLRQIPDERYSFKPAIGKWSKKEIMGHLIDSAQSNIRRFVVTQYEDTPHIVYNQDKWVLASAYQQWHVTPILELWALLNKQIAAILRTMPETAYSKTCLTQEEHTLEWLAADYVKHLLQHLHVVLELQPVAYL